MGTASTSSEQNIQLLNATTYAGNTYYLSSEEKTVVLNDPSTHYNTLDASAINSNNFGFFFSDFLITTWAPGWPDNSISVQTYNGNSITNVILGSGNDDITDPGTLITLDTGGGADFISGLYSLEVLDGGDGYDLLGLKSFDSYQIQFLENNALILTDLSTNVETTVRNVESFVFSGFDRQKSYAEILKIAEGRNLIADDVQLKFTGNNYEFTYRTDAFGPQSQFHDDIGSTNPNDYLSIVRDETGIVLGNGAPSLIQNFSLTYKDDLDIHASSFENMEIRLGGNADSSVDIATNSGTVITGNGDDFIRVTLGANSTEGIRVYGNAGSDKIEISDYYTSVSKVFGGDGNDFVRVVSKSAEYVYGENGSDYISFYGVTQGAIFRAYGGEGSDNIGNFEYGKLVAYGGDGEDSLFVAKGIGYLYGDAGNDDLKGGTANDILYGGSGWDEIRGGDGSDRAYGGDDNDLIHGDNGDDVVSGDNGNDILIGGNGSDQIYGGEGNDILRGGHDIANIIDNDSDSLYGGAGDDHLYGGGGVDYLTGDSGADTFHFDLTSIDRVRDFSLAEGDKLDISNLLSGYQDGVSDINDFIRLNVIDSTRTNLSVNTDGSGNDFQYVGIIYGDLIGQTVDTLHDSGALVAG